MGSEKDHKLHIFFFPYMAPGHTIPMTDMAKLFAMRGVKSTVVVTPLDAATVSRSIDKTQKLGFDIHTATIHLPFKEVDLPEDFEFKHLKSAQSPDMRQKFMAAVRLLDQPLERLIDELRPDCVVADVFLPWTTSIAAKFGVPRLIFHGTGFFPLGISHVVAHDRPFDNVSDDSEPFVVLNFPGNITLTRAKVPDFLREETEFTKLYMEAKDSELKSYGVVVNSFYELESVYADHYSKVVGVKSWGIGPLLTANNSIEQKLERGKGDEGSTNHRHECLKWLDSKDPDSVIYICFGSTTNFHAHQLHQIAVGLEASGQQFVWVVKKDENVDQGAAEQWLPQGYEERNRETGIIVRGWAPQVSILEHKAIGSFVTHCGWNSTLEGISAGVSMVTWPVAAEQFYNEILLTEVLKIGVSVGVKKWTRMVGDEVSSEMVEKAVKRVMANEENMRGKARELSEMAKRAVEEGGYSYLALNSLLEELTSKRMSI